MNVDHNDEADSNELRNLTVNDRKYVFHFGPKPKLEKHLALGRIPKPKVQIYVKIGGILLKLNVSNDLTAVFFETGAMPVPTKSRNPTICG